MNRKRRKDASGNDDVGLHDVRLIVASGPYRGGCGFVTMVLLALIFAGGMIPFVLVGFNDPIAFLGAALFFAGSAMLLYMAFGFWKLNDRSGLEAAAIRVSGPSQLVGQTLTLHIVQSKRKAVRINAMIIQLFIGRAIRKPNSKRGWEFTPNGIEYVDPHGKLYRDEKPFLTQSISDSSDTESVELTIRLEIPQLPNRREQDCKWGLRLTTTMEGDLPDCNAEYYLPAPVLKVVTGPDRQSCPDCKNEYTKAKKQGEKYTVIIRDSESSVGEDLARDYEVHRCPHCGTIVKQTEISSRWI